MRATWEEVSPSRKLTELGPAVCIFGGGLSGLTAALKIKAARPELAVLVVEKPKPESNTQLSGMRLRMGIPHQRGDPTGEILALLARRNGGRVTSAMRLFADVLVAEFAYWHGLPGFVEHHDRPEWFGPQWGSANRAGYGRGRAVIDWLWAAAASAGVRFLPAVLRHLDIRDGRVASAVVMASEAGRIFPATIEAGSYVIASGSAAGLLFSSTNKKIHWSGHEVAFHSGLTLAGSTLHMVHPFGNCGSNGRSRVGCLETDLLATSTVLVTDDRGTTSVDAHTTELLARHEAHDHFPELTRRLSVAVQPIQLIDPAGRITFACVSEHYHHLGIKTTDGLRIAEAGNAYAIGDAAGIGFWTNYRERQPGFALSKCLVDAALLARAIEADPPVEPALIRAPSLAQLRQLDGQRARAEVLPRIAPLNTRYLFALARQDGEATRLTISRRWADEVRDIILRHGLTSLGLISLAMASAHAGTLAEPIDINLPTALGLLTRDAIATVV